MLSLAARINADVLCTLQLAGIAVLAIGLWLRFDSQTKSIFEQENNNSSFYTGEEGRLGASSNCGDAGRVDPGPGQGKTSALPTLASHVTFKPCFCVVVPMHLHLTVMVSFSC